MAPGDFAAMARPPTANMLASADAHQYKARWAGRAFLASSRVDSSTILPAIA
jgi:hypothetical protein